VDRLQVLCDFDGVFSLQLAGDLAVTVTLSMLNAISGIALTSPRGRAERFALCVVMPVPAA
jgi:hypothetical protein